MIIEIVSNRDTDDIDSSIFGVIINNNFVIDICLNVDSNEDHKLTRDLKDLFKLPQIFAAVAKALRNGESVQIVENHKFNY